jgi:glycerate 2-kinase
MSEDPARPDWAARLRRDATAFFRAGVAAAEPGGAVLRHLRAQDTKLFIRRADKKSERSADWTAVRVLAFGKAALAMARAAASIIPKPLFRGPGIAVTNYENVAALPGFAVMGAGHPLPDANGVAAAKAVAETTESAGQGELVLVLISGGGSALLPYPAEGLTLADKIATTNLLLASGADIGEINAVRKHLSRLKGGGLARLAAPADLHALILSDVLGDDLSTIASGTTVPDPTSFGDARGVLVRRGAWDKVPAPVRARIENGIAGKVPETPKPGDPVFVRSEATLVGSNAVSLASVKAAAEASGYRVVVFSNCLTGEAREAARSLAALAAREKGPVAIIAGGETTVTLKGKGKGGRNQEMALAFAVAAEEMKLAAHCVFLSGGTDGRDGPTDAAGGLTDPETASRIRAKGADPKSLLDDNDSYRALELAGDLLRTGATGTNVADLQILLIGG